jgi:hypothetical protein
VSEKQPPQEGALSPEEAERLSERLRPSWELDEPPVSAPAQALTAGEPQAPVFASPIVPVNASPPLPGQTIAEPTASPTYSQPPAALAPGGPNATRAASRAKHARTVMGLAPPGSSEPPPANPAPVPTSAPNAYAVAVPPSRPTPAMNPRVEHALPSVVLADQTGPELADLGAAAQPPVSVDPSASDLDDDDFPVRRSRKGPVIAALVLALAGGVGAYALLTPTKSEPPPSPDSVATPNLHATAPTATVPQAATAPPAVAPIATPPTTPTPATPSPPPQVVAPAPVPVAPAPTPVERPREVQKPSNTNSSADDGPPPSRKRESGPSQGSGAAAQRPASPKSNPKPSTPTKPSGGIVRDVPF